MNLIKWVPQWCYLCTLWLWVFHAQGQGSIQPATFVQVSPQNPAYFQTSDGKTYLPIGLNLCWPRFIDDEGEGLAKMEFYFRELSRNGGNYARIFLSAPFWEIEPVKAGQYDEQKLARLDKLVALAQQYGIRLKFCMEHFRQLTNSPPRFPGSVPFDRPPYATANGGPVTDMTEYLATNAGRQLFLNRARKLADHFANHPAVFGWELWNEMDAVKGKGWEAWTETVLGDCQRLFPNHLVMQSLGSYDNESKRPMYQRITQLSTNDVAQVHRYIDAGAKWAVCQAPMAELASQAITDLRSFDRKKPVIGSELGAVEANHAGPWKLYPNDTIGVLLHDILFAPFFSGAAGPGHCWHWDSYVEKNNLWWHFGRFAEAVKGFDPVREQAVPFKKQLPNNVVVYGLRGKTQVLLWVRDEAVTWQTELVNGLPARKMNGVVITGNEFAAKQVRFFDPWQNRWTSGSANTVRLPAFTRSLIVKLELQ